MMNQVNLIGRLTKDVELKTSKAGKSFARFTVAVDDFVNSDGEKNTNFIGCMCFGGTAEFLSKYAEKGSLVGIAGKIVTGSYEAEDGKTVYTTDVFVNSLDLLSYKKDEAKEEKKSSYKKNYRR